MKGSFIMSFQANGLRKIYERQGTRLEQNKFVCLQINYKTTTFALHGLEWMKSALEERASGSFLLFK